MHNREWLLPNSLQYGASITQAGHPVTMLSVQYRMHPKISSFISQYFYQKQLKDGPDLDRCAGQLCR